MKRHDFKYGIPVDTWDAAKEEARQAMIAVARSEATIPYSDLASRIRSFPFGPDESRFHQLLGEISTGEDAAGRGLLTVVVVHKTGDMTPGPGFFKLAKRRGRDISDQLRCWSEEMKKVHASRS